MTIELLESPVPVLEENATKHCSGCGRDRPLTEFHRDRTQNDGYKSRCRDCRSEANRGRTAPRPYLTPEQQKAADEKAIINRNALLRLVKSHRAEFESYVNAETIRVTGTSSGAAWVRLA